MNRSLRFCGIPRFSITGRWLLGVALSLVVVASCLAQSASEASNKPITKDPRGIAIAQTGMLAAGNTPSGGIILKGQALMPGISDAPMDVVLEFNGSKQMRSQIATPKGNVVWVIRDGQGAVQRGSGPVRHLSENNTIFHHAIQVPALSHLNETGNPTVNVEYIGTDQVNGVPVQVISFSLAPPHLSNSAFFTDITRTLYDIDPTTGHVLRVRSVNVAENDSNARQKLETIFSDYRTVNGVAIPFHQKVFADGSLRQDLTITSAETGVSLPDSDFLLPN